MVAAQHERPTLIEAAVCDIHTRLFGNGQPGELAHLKRDARRLEREVHSLKGWQWAERGALAALMLLLKYGSHLKGIFG